MAGDHRCPVCQSTFTRPQHVARHMRSHTGDRPYKCQHCGDQFARSDLLSRHVNKCHASDRPANTTSRRRGSNNHAARAAVQPALAQQQPQQNPILSPCDQCKHAGLACDLRSPCTTCHQRRISCTYPRVRSSTGRGILGDSFSASAVYPPPNLSVPSLLPSSNLYSDAGLSSYPSHLFAPSLSAASDLASRSSTSLGLPPTQASDHNLLDTFPHFSSTANPGAHLNGTHPMLPVPNSAPPSQNHFGWNAGSASGLPNDFNALAHSMNQPRPSSLVTDFMFDLPDSRPSTGSLPSPRSLIDMTQPPVDIYGFRRDQHSHSHSRSGTDSDFSSSSSPSLSRGSFSTGSSNAVLPDMLSSSETLRGIDNTHPFAYDPHQPAVPGRNEVVANAFGLLNLGEAMRNGTAGAQFYQNQPASAGYQPEKPEDQSSDSWSRPADRPATSGGEMSSSTGQMSDQVPLVNGLPAVSPATEAREMREFWKNFMVDPYATGTTPQVETPGALRTPHASGRPGFLRGLSLSKSASLPPIRRQSQNTIGANERYAYDDSTPHASMAQQLGHAVNTAAPPKSVVNHADLRSYEEAIKSRPPPVLKFDPRFRLGPSGMPDRLPKLRLRGGDASDGEASGPPSESTDSRRGSLANDESSIPSIRHLMPQGDGFAGAAYSSSDDSSNRPSFKRVASQSIGPAYSKKAAHHRLGNNAEDSASSASEAPEEDSGHESSEDDSQGVRSRHARGLRAGRRPTGPGILGTVNLAVQPTGA